MILPPPADTEGLELIPPLCIKVFPVLLGHFADTIRGIAALLKMLRKKLQIRHMKVWWYAIIENTGRFRTLAAEKGRARWVAQRNLRIGVGEPDGSLAKSINMRRLGSGVKTQAGQVTIHIFGNENDDIEGLLVSSSPRNCASPEEDEDMKKRGFKSGNADEWGEKSVRHGRIGEYVLSTVRLRGAVSREASRFSRQS